ADQRSHEAASTVTTPRTPRLGTCEGGEVARDRTDGGCVGETFDERFVEGGGGLAIEGDSGVIDGEEIGDARATGAVVVEEPPFDERPRRRRPARREMRGLVATAPSKRRGDRRRPSLTDGGEERIARRRRGEGEARPFLQTLEGGAIVSGGGDGDGE